MKKRKQIIAWLFKHGQKIYLSVFKRNKAWGINKKDLGKLPLESFGKALEHYLSKHGFEIIPKMERHDAYHALSGYGCQVEDEIALQYLCFGNGKRSLYTIGIILVGTLLLPEYIHYYNKSYVLGRRSNTFYDLPFKELLEISHIDLQATIFLKSQLQLLRSNS